MIFDMGAYKTMVLYRQSRLLFSMCMCTYVHYDSARKNCRGESSKLYRNRIKKALKRQQSIKIIPTYHLDLGETFVGMCKTGQSKMRQYVHNMHEKEFYSFSPRPNEMHYCAFKIRTTTTVVLAYSIFIFRPQMVLHVHVPDIPQYVQYTTYACFSHPLFAETTLSLCLWLITLFMVLATRKGERIIASLRFRGETRTDRLDIQYVRSLLL